MAVFTTFAVAAAPRFSDWSAPQNLGPTVNSTSSDIAPAISKDGLSLYFASNRPPPPRVGGGFDIWVSQRASVDSEWGTPQNLGPLINTAALENLPNPGGDLTYPLQFSAGALINTAGSGNDFVGGTNGYGNKCR